MIDHERLKEAQRALASAQDDILRLVDNIHMHNERIDHLIAQGTTDGRPHWREGKYLYLIHPQRNGDRRREYIGNDPDKVAKALAKVERTEQAQSHRHQREKAASQLNSLISRALRLDPDRETPLW